MKAFKSYHQTHKQTDTTEIMYHVTFRVVNYNNNNQTMFMVLSS